MSIEVQGLTKIYGSQRALDNISFSVDKGEILGFLGPNGAGKSTTMKIATAFIPPSSGTVRVAGFDVLTDSLDVRKNVGYLPEHNPLYLDMYVHEYLHFIGEVHQLGRAAKHRIAEVIELCGLELEQHKLIGALSKGYRQRVGLAQALLHDPKVLILDEPTTGLDPNQIQEIRNLIKSISSDKTVVFSTHIMQEVQAICDRVVIIDKGKIVADKSVIELKQGLDQQVLLSVELKGVVNIELLKALNGVQEVIRLAEGKFQLVCTGNDNIRKEVVSIAAKNEWDLVGLSLEEKSLEGIFRDLTSKEA